MATMEKNTLEGKVAAELHEIASDLGIEGHKGLKKADLIDRILTHANGAQAPSSAETATEQRPDRVGSGDGYVDSRERSGNERSGNERSGNGGERTGNAGVRTNERQNERQSERPQQERFDRERSGGGGGPARDQGAGTRWRSPASLP